MNFGASWMSRLRMRTPKGPPSKASDGSKSAISWAIAGTFARYVGRVADEDIDPAMPIRLVEWCQQIALPHFDAVLQPKMRDIGSREGHGIPERSQASMRALEPRRRCQAPIAASGACVQGDGRASLSHDVRQSSRQAAASGSVSLRGIQRLRSGKKFDIHEPLAAGEDAPAECHPTASAPACPGYAMLLRRERWQRVARRGLGRHR
jgi:hypothetical protein